MGVLVSMIRMSMWSARGVTRMPFAVSTRSLFIQTRETPNHDSLQFLPGQPVLEDGTAEFRNYKEAQKSPLARNLFRIEGVKNVFYGPDFISVNKDPESEWALLKPQVFREIMEHYSSGEELISDQAALTDVGIKEDDSEVVQQIKEIIDTRVRPYVQSDGGEITFMGFEEGVVLLKLSGARSGCPSSSVTLKHGVEKVLLHYVPEVISVMHVEEDEMEQLGLKRFEKLEEKLEQEKKE